MRGQQERAGPHLAREDALHVVVRVGDDEVAQAQLAEHAVRALQRERLRHGGRAAVHVRAEVHAGLERAAVRDRAVHAAALRGGAPQNFVHQENMTFGPWPISHANGSEVQPLHAPRQGVSLVTMGIHYDRKKGHESIPRPMPCSCSSYHNRTHAHVRPPAARPAAAPR